MMAKQSNRIRIANSRPFGGFIFRCQSLVRLALLAAFPLAGGCTDILSPAAINSLGGGYVPVTPGPLAAFILVRGANQTNQVVEFILTVEIEKLVTDENGNYVTDDQGNFLTEPERRTTNLTTFPGVLASDFDVLFDCSLDPVTVIGLGENLLPTDAAVLVGGSGPTGVGGVGVTAEGLNPLTFAAGNFTCGDTIIYTAFDSVGTPGGVLLRSDKLVGNDQPDSYEGPSTFENYAEFLESQVPEDD